MYPPELLDKVCPFHLVLDRDLEVRRSGSAFQALLGEDITGSQLLQVVTVARPPVSSAERLRALAGASLLCRLQSRPLSLRAQLIALGEDGFLFVAAPWLTNEEEFHQAGLSLALAAPHEGWADFLMHTQLLGQQRRDLEKLVVQLEEGQAHLRAIIDTAADAIISIDEHGMIERVNPAVERLFGYSPEELLGQDVSNLIPLSEPAPRGRTRRIYAILGTGQEVTASRADGTHFPAELMVSEYFVQARRRYSCLIRDISERKRLERLQSDFVSTVSHELRTPLTSIRGALGLLAGGVTGELPEESRECVDIALANSQRLIRLINDILDMEKIQSGRMELRMKYLFVGPAVKAAIAANEAFAAAHRVSLVLVGEPPEAGVFSDEDRLAQVLANLLSNAVKFSPPDAVVAVAVERAGAWVRVTVTDRGPGIPEEIRDRIFQRFVQADTSTTRQRGGTGLGLSISKALVEKMRGRIGFEVKGGVGTAFYFELPLAL